MGEYLPETHLEDTPDNDHRQDVGSEAGRRHDECIQQGENTLQLGSVSRKAFQVGKLCHKEPLFGQSAFQLCQRAGWSQGLRASHLRLYGQYKWDEVLRRRRLG